MEIFDISPLIHQGLGVFPGDVRYCRTPSLSLQKGDSVTLSHIETTLHLGAHADAPSHYCLGGESIDKRLPERYLGPAQVYEVNARGRRITAGDLTTPVLAPRVLFKTGSFPNPDQWNGDFASLSGEAIDRLAAQGVQLVGIDTPSIDPEQDKVLESHQAVFRHDMAVLEGLVLEAVPPGVYTLIALPLRLRGADASPVRAVLVQGIEDLWKKS